VLAVANPQPGRLAGDQGPRRGGRVSNRAKLGLVLLLPLLAAGCQLPSFGFFRGSTTQGQSTFKLIQGFMLSSFVVGGIVLVLILWSVLRYRRRKSQSGLPRQSQYVLPLEIVYTVTPILIVLALFAFTVVTENNVDAVSKNPDAVVNVTAFQWGWRFSYPGQGVVVEGVELQEPTMVVPAGQTVRITLRSTDVIHGFYVPQFNFSRYATPGYSTTFDIDVNQPGVYRGQCTQLCGLYHSLMIFQVKAVTPTQYRAWLAKTAATERLTGRSVT
jgi:cytochrome c oxidase subunit II